jgi:hypothetical protein
MPTPEPTQWQPPIADFAGLTREPRSCLGRWPGSGEQHGVSPGSIRPICAAVSVADDRFAVGTRQWHRHIRGVSVPVTEGLMGHSQHEHGRLFAFCSPAQTRPQLSARPTRDARPVSARAKGAGCTWTATVGLGAANHSGHAVPLFQRPLSSPTGRASSRSSASAICIRRLNNHTRRKKAVRAQMNEASIMNQANFV